MNRRGFLGSAVAAAAGAQEPKRPNVLILMSDQHRPDWLTCGGVNTVPTPNIDRIAAQGVRFTRAYCPYPVCAPSRMSFLTGLHAHHHGVTDNRVTLDWRRRTMAHAFRDAGYVTGLVGKMHFLDGHSHGFDFRLGFNDWLMYLGPKVRHFADEIASYPGYEKLIYDTGSGLPDIDGLWPGDRSPWIGTATPKRTLASDLSTEDQFDSFVARETSKLIRRYQDQPFFLVAGFLKPHAPFHPPREFAERFPADRVALPNAGDLSQYPEHVRTAAARFHAMGEQRLRMIRAGYCGNLQFVDTCIGEVWRTLEDKGLADDTIVVYTSDHGEMAGEHGLFQKFVFFEPSAGVPLIVSYPRKLPRGQVSQALVEYLGIYPTVAELAGLKSPFQIDGTSFASLARDPSLGGPDAAFAEYALSWAPRYMVRTRRYKYNFNEGDRPELYDMEADPGEYRNLAGAAAHSKTVRGLHDRLVAWYDPARNPYRPAGKRK